MDYIYKTIQTLHPDTGCGVFYITGNFISCNIKTLREDRTAAVR